MTMRDFCARNEQVDPPDVPWCTWCGGFGELPLFICTDDGEFFDLDRTTTCPRCTNTGGLEPKPDPADDPRVP